MPRSLLTALAVVTLMPLTAQAQSSALEGEWVGGFQIEEISGYLRFDVVSEGQQLEIVLASVRPGGPQGSALRDLNGCNGGISFKFDSDQTS